VRGGQPLLDPVVFRVRALSAGVACQLLLYCQQAAGYLLLALYLQDGRGLSPIESGGVFSALAVGFLVTSFRAPALTVRFGRRIVVVGALVAALGDMLLVLGVIPSGASVAALLPGLFLLGAGQGLCLTPLTTTVLSHASSSHAGSVSGTLATAQQVGNAVGVAVSGVIFYTLLSHGDGYGVAYRWSALEMTVLLVGVAGFAFLIPAATAVTAAAAANPSKER